MIKFVLFLSSKVKSYTSKHFSKVIESEEFLNLNDQQLCNLLSRDDLNVNCESVVFIAVLDWVKFDLEKRRSCLDNLFQCVRFGHMPPQILSEQMKYNDIFKLKETDKSKLYLQNIFNNLMKRSPCHFRHPRLPSLPFALYIIGGYHKQSVNTVECFRYKKQKWEPGANMNIARSGVCCVSVALYIYAIGGRNNTPQGNYDCADVECYDPFVNV